MSIALDYVRDAKTVWAHHEFFNSDGTADTRKWRLFSIIKWTFVLVAAIYLAIRIELLVLAAVFAWLLLSFLVRLLPFSRIEEKVRLEIEQSTAKRNIHLVIDDDGLHETDSGVQAFAPWSSVLCFALFKQFIFIKLANSQWATVPTTAIPTEAKQIIQILLARGIKQLPSDTPYDEKANFSARREN